MPPTPSTGEPWDRERRNSADANMGVPSWEITDLWGHRGVRIAPSA
jgi:hypothetical protein